MKWTQYLTGLSAVMFLLPALEGNGGGYYFGIKETGTLAPFQPQGLERIQIKTEVLKIKLFADYAKVSVYYEFENSGDKTEIVFGFPVEEAPTYYSSEENKNTAPPGIRSYEVRVGEKVLASEWRKVSQDERNQIVNLKGMAGWLVSKSSVPAKANYSMSIQYEVEHEGGIHSISDDEWSSGLSFAYRLSTGAAWGGPIEEGKIVITRGEGVKSFECELKQPLDKFEKTETGWKWDFKNLEPGLEHDLKIAVSPGWSSRSYGYVRGKDSETYYQAFQYGDQWSRVHEDYSVTASSTLAPQGEHTYEVENIKFWSKPVDGTTSGLCCWSEGAKGPGEGEFLLITPEKKEPLLGISLYGGYFDYGNPLYEKNARPKKIRAILNGNHEDVFVLNDRMQRQFLNFGEYREPIETIKLIFEEVYPGSHYEDLCISQLSLLTPVDKEPDHQGAR